MKILTGQAGHLLRLAAGWRRVAARAESPAKRDSDLAEASRLFHRAITEGGAR